MKRENRILTAALGVTDALVLLVGVIKLYMFGPLGELFSRRETYAMGLELAVIFLGILWILNRGRKNSIWLWLVPLLAVSFLWLHQVFVPVAVAGIYVLFLFLLGRFFCNCLGGGGWKDCSQTSRVMIGFLAGCSLFLLLACGLSLMGRGSIGELRRISLILGGLLFLWEIRRFLPVRSTGPGNHRRKLPGRGECLFLAVILTMVLLQAGRLNVALDYDSLHYGLRSQYVLDSGRGIYENLGQINVVYTYSKGLETLLLPLSGLPSYSFVLSFSLWMAVGVLWSIYHLAKRLSSSFSGLLAALFVSCIPGVMNLAVSAKTDMITLLFQLFFLYFMLEYLERKANICLLAGGASFLFTWVLKPTALVFSAVLFLAAFCFLLRKKKMVLRLRDRWWIFVGVVAASVGGILLRTYLLTGVPMASVFTSLMEGIGFTVKYPFAYGGIPQNGGSALSADGIVHLARRLWGVAAAPVGEDMAHVLIAWGSGLTLVFPVLLLLCYWRRKRAGGNGPALTVAFWDLTLVLLALVSVASVHMLWQVDGNYFMLFYAVLAVRAAAAVSGLQDGKLGEKVLLLLWPVLCFNIAVTMVTNWAGVTGFSPIRLVHRGYYDHQQVVRERMADLGNQAIWDILADDSRTRVLAVGEEPLVLLFPCNVQTYNDMSGSGGNVELVKTLDRFKEFLAYAGTEYLYVQARFVKQDSRVYDLVTYLIEDGSLTDIRTESGNLIGTVNLDGSRPADTAAGLEVWTQDYYLAK